MDKMPVKHFLFILVASFNLSLFAGPNDRDDHKDSEFQTYKDRRDKLRAKDKQNLLAIELYETRNLSSYLSRDNSLSDVDIHRFIRILLRGQESIDYKYWTIDHIDLAIDEILATLDVRGDFSKGSSAEALINITHNILRVARMDFLDLMLEDKYARKSFQVHIYSSSEFSIDPLVQRVLMEVLLNGEEFVDYELWSETNPVNMVDEAVKITTNKLSYLAELKSDQNQELIKKLVEHILVNARHVPRKISLEKFANETPVAQRAQQLKGPKVININSAIEKVRK